MHECRIEAKQQVDLRLPNEGVVELVLVQRGNSVHKESNRRYFRIRLETRGAGTCEFTRHDRHIDFSSAAMPLQSKASN